MRRPEIRPGWTLILSILIGGFLTPARAVPTGVGQIETSPSGVSFVLTAPEGEVVLVERPGEPPSLEIEGLGSIPSGAGWQLPGRTVWIGLPTEGDVAIDVEPLGRTDFRPGETRGRIPASEELPAASVRLGRPSWFHNQRVVSVTWMPLVQGHFGPIWESAVRIRLRFESPEGGAGSFGRGDRWENSYRELLINYEESRTWRRQARPRPRRQGDFFSSTANPWLRIEVEQHGTYAISGADLQTAQIDLATIDDPETTLRLYTGRGLSLPEATPVTELPVWLEQVAIEVEGVEDGTFDPQDRILFRGLGPDGWYGDYGVDDALYERFKTDEFSNTNTYWLSWGAFEEPAARWMRVDGRNVPTPAETTASHRIHYEENRFWDPHPWEVSSGQDYQNPDSLPNWEKWYWLELIGSASVPRLIVPFDVPDPDPNAQASLLVRLWGATDNLSSSLPDHYINVDLNGALIAEGIWNRRDHLDLVAEGISLEGEEQELGLTVPYVVDTLAFRVDRSYLAFFELDYRRRLEWQEEDLEFYLEPGTDRVGFELSGFDDTTGIAILDVTDPDVTTRIVPLFQQDGTTFRAFFGVDPESSKSRHFVVTDLGAASAPEIERDRQPADGYLRERTDPIDYILVTHENALDAGERLAAWRREHSPDGSGFQVALVDVQDIYDEFSAGRIDPTAIRNFLHFAFLNWNGGDPNRSPAYVCLLGDGSYDFRNRKGQRGDLIVPTYEGYFVSGLLSSIYSPQFASDDWLVLFDEAPDPILDMAIGRLPADSRASAEALVDKVIAYESTQGVDNWPQRFTLVADDICQGLSYDYPLLFTHTRQTEDLYDETVPVELEPDRIYLYEYGTECVYDRKPAAAEALLASIERGTLVINYTGHGSEEQLADERVLETPGVAGMTNADRLFFFLTASCSVGKYDFAGEGLGEALIRQPQGGAIGVFSATAVAFSGANAELNREVFRAIFPDREVLDSQPMGQAAVLAKANVTRPERVGNRRYPLLMEPAVRLATPRLRIGLTIEGTDSSGVAVADTIYRGARVRASGSVVDAAGNLQSDFSGTVSFQVYDSEIVRKGSVQFSSVEYNLIGAPIYRGEGVVEGGTFTSDFIAPAALRIGERGTANFYAWAKGQDGRFAIGGRGSIDVPEVEPPESADQEGPRIELTVDGDLDDLPLDAPWEASLFDSSGINITQLVPARSVRLRIEEGTRLVGLEDLADQVVFPEDFREGRLTFSLPEELEGGRRYRLTLEAFDNLDHQGSASVEFVARGSEDRSYSLGRIYNVPNPMDQGTAFFLEIGETSTVTIRIFTVTGKQIRRIDRSGVDPGSAIGSGIWWDGRDEDGDRLGNGVYFYKVSVRANSGASDSRIERLAVLR